MSPLTYNVAKDKGLKGSNYLTWSAVCCAVPKNLRKLTVKRKVLNTLELKCGNKDFHPLMSKSKNFYASLIKEKAKHLRGFTKLMSDFHLRWLNRVMQDHEARASDLNRKLIFSFFLLFS